jgi:hypothetical protein
MAVPNLISKLRCNENIPENHNIKKQIYATIRFIRVMAVTGL